MRQTFYRKNFFINDYIITKESTDGFFGFRKVAGAGTVARQTAETFETDPLFGLNALKMTPPAAADTLIARKQYGLTPDPLILEVVFSLSSAPAALTSFEIKAHRNRFGTSPTATVIWGIKFQLTGTLWQPYYLSAIGAGNAETWSVLPDWPATAGLNFVGPTRWHRVKLVFTMHDNPYTIVWIDNHEDVFDASAPSPYDSAYPNDEQGQFIDFKLITNATGGPTVRVGELILAMPWQANPLLREFQDRL